FRSPGNTGIISSYSRAARADRLRRRWLLPWRVFTSLPVPVYSKRRAAALCVFSFGMEVGGRQVYHTRRQCQLQNQLRIPEPETARVRHFRIAVLAHAERDRHLGDAEPRALCLDRAFELDAETRLVQGDSAQNARPGGAETAGQIARGHAQHSTHRRVADNADSPPSPRYAAHPTPLYVARAEYEIVPI